jgi:hypothetical protein
VRFDRKLLLIAPTVVLFFVAAGLIYAAVQLHVLKSVSESWDDRSDFISAVEAGRLPLDTRQAVGLLRISMDVEARRSAAISATRDLLVSLSMIVFVSCITLVGGIQGVRRQHWPRMSFKGKRLG